jgi:subtilisin-like proprotein convertase family protein/C1A family cysteine protease
VLKKVLKLLPLLLVLLFLSSFSAQADDVPLGLTRGALEGSPQVQQAIDATSACGGGAPGMANPAAVYCDELGYEYQVVDAAEGQHGICVLPDGSECDGWGFLQGKCGQSYSYCATQGYDLVTKSDGKNSFSGEYGVCVRDGQEVGSVTELMGLAEKATKGSRRVEQALSPLEEEASVGAPPSSFDWRSYNRQDWMTPVKDQASCGGCWAFSAVGTTEAVHNIAASDPNLDLDLSEEYLVSDCYPLYNQSCCGGWQNLALEFIRDSGIPDEDCLPWVSYTCSCGESGCSLSCTDHTGGSCANATCSDKCGDSASRLQKISSTGSVLSSQIKQYVVEKGPLSVAMGILLTGSDFDANGVYRCTGDEYGYTLNHAVVIAGYNDDAGGYWIVKNSWGTSWDTRAPGGYFKVGYGECGIETDVYYATVSAPCDPVIPGTYSGSVVINGVPAPDGTMIQALIDGVEWGSDTTSGGNYAMDIPATLPVNPPCFPGGQLLFEADGIICAPSPEWSSGSHTGVNLVCVEACNVYPSTDTPIAIPDLGVANSVISVPAGSAISDVNVTLNITHTWDADLDVFLISPQGTEVELFTDVGSSGNNFTGTILDDECATPITSGTAPFTDCYQPEGSLAALDGQNSAGQWRLEITDASEYDSGTLTSWELELCGEAPTPNCDPGVDTDGDGFDDDVECYLVTDPLDACPDGPTDDAWPLDVSKNGQISVVADILNFRGRIGATPSDPTWSQRLDFNADGQISVVGDVLMYRGMIGETCT